MKKNFILLILFLSYVPAFAANINGRVVDENGKGIPSANIAVLSAGNANLVKADYTDNNGFFNVGQLAHGTYLLKVMLVGYVTYSSGELTIGDSALTLPDIKMVADGKQLTEVTVRAVKPFIEVKPDMLVVNVENSIVNAGSSAFDVLSRSPGVIIDQNDNISLKGKQGVTIMINGRIQPLSADDLANILKGMPSNAIEKIELISNPSARYDAAGSAGITNIVMKKDQRMGANGSVNAGYAQGVYPKANGGFNLNYRTAKANLYANYNYAYREGFNRLVLTRNFYGDSLRYDQNHMAKLPFNSNTLNVGMDYNLTPHTTLGVALNGGTTNYNSSGTVVNDATNTANGSLEKTENTTTYSNNKWNNYEVDVNVKHNIDTAGKVLTIDADYIRFWNTNTQDLNTTTINYLPGVYTPPYLLTANITGLTQIASIKADYEMPFLHTGKLEGGIKSSYVTADNQPSFYDVSTGTPVFDRGKSDHFIYSENINAAYINVMRDYGKWSLHAGLRAELTINKGDEKVNDTVFTHQYIQLFPSMGVQRHLNKDNDLGLSLSKRIERPTYRQLNPYKFYSDPTTVKEGDPNIDPETTYSLELSHTWKQRLVTTFTYSITNKPITELLLPAPFTSADKVTIQTQSNMSKMTYWGISGAYTIPIFKWWNNVTNINAYYSEYQGNLANTPIKNGSPTFDINSSNSFVLPANFSAELSIYYQDALQYGYFYLRPLSMINFGIQKNIWKKKATIRLNGTDIFWHGYPSAISHYTGYDESFTAKRDTRQFTLSFTYRFGKNTVQQVRRHNSGAEEEKKRASDNN